MRWLGRGVQRSRDCQPQIGNAHKDFVDLTPVSEAPALAVKAAWEPMRLQPSDYQEDEHDEEC